MSHDSKYCKDQILDQLLGGTIVGVIGVPEDADPDYFGIQILLRGKRKFMWIQSDAEGNNAGWVDIEDAPSELDEKEAG